MMSYDDITAVGPTHPGNGLVGQVSCGDATHQPPHLQRTHVGAAYGEVMGTIIDKNQQASELHCIVGSDSFN